MAWCMVDFEQFIYLILRCTCFSRSFLLLRRLHRLRTLPLDSLCVRIMAEEAKKKRNSTTISWLFGNQLTVTFLTLTPASHAGEIHWKTFHISFSLSDFSFSVRKIFIHQFPLLRLCAKKKMLQNATNRKLNSTEVKKKTLAKYILKVKSIFPHWRKGWKHIFFQWKMHVQKVYKLIDCWTFSFHSCSDG